MKSFITTVALAFALSAASVVDSVDVDGSGWLDLTINLNEADARGRGGKRGGGHRGSGPRRSAHTSSRRGRHKGRSRHGRDVDIDIDVDHRRRVGLGGVVAGALVVGAIVSSLPPSCSTVIVDGISYHRCDGVYYEPSYRGTDVVYVVVDDPY